MSGIRCTLALALLALAPIARGQSSYVWSPYDCGNVPGGSGNTVPFWSTSATYQQIHDSRVMGPALQSIKGLALRNWGGVLVNPGRQCNMWLRIGSTSATSSAPSTTFTTNLGSATDVFGASAALKPFRWTDSTSTGPVNPPAFTIPFATPWVYVAGNGNVCWEWRFKDSTSVANAVMDYVAVSAQRGTINASSGTGCTATGSTVPASAMVRIQLGAEGYDYQSILQNGSRSAAAIMAFGDTAGTFDLGWCATLRFRPDGFFNGMTDTQGNWTVTVPIIRLAGIPARPTLVQFAFADPGLPYGIGLSDMSSWTSADVPGAAGIARIYRSAQYGTVNTDDVATTGFASRWSGLVVGWLQ